MFSASALPFAGIGYIGGVITIREHRIIPDSSFKEWSLPNHIPAFLGTLKIY
jgi:hypothetical protein